MQIQMMTYGVSIYGFIIIILLNLLTFNINYVCKLHLSFYKISCKAKNNEIHKLLFELHINNQNYSLTLTG